MDQHIYGRKFLYYANFAAIFRHCKFCQRKVKYLGYLVGDKFPLPKTQKQLYLGMTGWHCRVIPNFSAVTGNSAEKEGNYHI